MPLVCHNCGSTKTEDCFFGLTDREYNIPGKFDFCRCKSCGVIFMSPPPEVDKLLSFYPANYHGYCPPTSRLTRFLIRLNLKNRARLYYRLIGRTGDILDIGSADGAHFDGLNEFGDWSFTGLEFNDQAAAEGRRVGRKVFTNTIEGHDFFSQKFDLIIMNHLIEHVTDPHLTISSAASVLREGGYLVGETPNTDSFDFEVFKSYWGGLHTPRHTFLYNPSALSQLLSGHGLRLKKIEFVLDTSHWALSIQNVLQSYTVTKTKIRQGRTSYYPLFLAILIPINFCQQIFKKTGVMRFIAQKEKI